jgi:release factor glutamine methyltransferase
MTSGPESAGPTWRQLWRKSAALIVDPVQTRWLLERASGLDAAALLGAIDQVAPVEAAEQLENLVKRRLAGEPLQHVLGHWGFRHLDVAVDSRVLVPRPETEQLVTFALRELDRLDASSPHSAPPGSGRSGAGLLAVDLGTGSGVIALSLVTERDAVRVIATDRDLDALDVASGNLQKLRADAAARVELRQGDWYEALPAEASGRVHLIVANPPYLAEHEWSGLAPTVRDFDPFGALVAGPSGLEAVEAILAGAPTWLSQHASIVVEIAPRQAAAAAELAMAAGFGTANVEDDLAGRPRVLVARR